VGVVTYFMWPAAKPKPTKVSKAVQTSPVVAPKKPEPKPEEATPAPPPKEETKPESKPEPKKEPEPEAPEPEPQPELGEEKKEEEEVSAAPSDEGEKVQLGPYKGVVVSHIVGPHGSTLKSLEEQTGSKLHLNDDGFLEVVGGDAAKVKELVDKIVKEQAHPDYEGPKGKALRQRADSMRRDSRASFTQAQAAFDSGDKAKGHELMSKVKELNEKSKDTDLKAARAIFNHRNKNGHDELKFDLHGLHVQEALDLFTEELESLQEEEKSERVLEVIPGAGHHSKGGEGHAKLKPAVLKFLKDEGLEVHEHNAGSVFVNLDGMDKEAFDAKCEELS